MLFNTLMLIGYLLPYVGLFAVIAIWWPNRNDPRFSSIPWILASKAIAFSLSILMPKIAALFPDWTAAPTSALIITSYTCTATWLFITHVQSFVIAWMIGANLAYLLQEASPVNRIQRFFALQHTHQRQLGIILLIISLLPFAILMVQCFSGCPPHFSK